MANDEGHTYRNRSRDWFIKQGAQNTQRKPWSLILNTIKLHFIPIQ